MLESYRIWVTFSCKSPSTSFYSLNFSRLLESQTPHGENLGSLQLGEGAEIQVNFFQVKNYFQDQTKAEKNVSFLIPVIKNCWLPAIGSFQSTFTTKLPVDIPCRVIMPSFIFCLTALAHHIGHRFSLSSAHSAQRGFCCVINMKSCIICYYYYYYYYTLFLRK